MRTFAFVHKPLFLASRIFAGFERVVAPSALLSVFRRRWPPRQLAPTVIYLCEGNVCRSPFAARYHQLRFPGRQILSYGVSEAEGRIPPPLALACAEPWGVELVSHSSRRIPSDVEGLDCDIFVMDRFNLLWLWRYRPKLLNRTFLLGGRREIPDPYHHDRTMFEEVYGQIARCIDHLHSHVVTVGGSGIAPVTTGRR